MPLDLGWRARTRAAIMRLAGLGHGTADERAMRDESAFHLEMETARNVRSGMTAADARRAAVASFGGVARWEEAARDELRTRWLEDIGRDVHFALRRLRRTSGSTATVIMMLALGVSANTAVFHVIDALLLQAPRVAAPGELLQLWNTDPKAASDIERHQPLSYPQYVYLRDHTRAFSGVVAFDGDPDVVTWRTPLGAEPVHAQFISRNFFTLLGVRAAAGLVALASNDSGDQEIPEVILSYAFWRDRLGGDPAVAGTSLTFNGRLLTVTGVAARDFTGLLAGMSPDVWIPLSSAPAVTHDPALLESKNSFWLLTAGRLKPGVTVSAALADARVLSSQFARGDPELAKLLPALFPLSLVPGPYRVYVAAFTGILQAVMILVLLIAAANATNLLLAQSAARSHEYVVRTALGASRGRLLRQALSETLLIALLAGALGGAAGISATALLLGLIPPSVPVRLSTSPDWRVGAFAMLLALIAASVCGLLSVARTLPHAQQTTPRATRGSARGSRLRNALVVLQVTGSFVLLVAGGLCLRSLARARQVDPGFRAEHRVIAKLDLKSAGYTPAASRAFFVALLDRVAQLSGVGSATVSSYLPLETTYRSAVVEPPPGAAAAGPERPGTMVQVFDVGPAFFRTLGTVVRGRDFEGTDDGRGAKVIVVNEAMARRWWPRGDAIGRTLRVQTGATNEPYLVIGVVPTGKYRALAERPQPVLFRAAFQHDLSAGVVIVDGPATAAASVESMRDAITRLDPNVAPLQLGTLDDQVAYALVPARIAGIVLSAMGSLGLALALTGLAASLAYGVALRTREIGIRIALGGQRSRILVQFGSEAGRLLAIGILFGLPLAWALVRVLRTTLAGVGETAPTTLLAVIALLVLAALCACWIPARRAMGVNPMEAIRHD